MKRYALDEMDEWRESRQTRRSRKGRSYNDEEFYDEEDLELRELSEYTKNKEKQIKEAKEKFDTVLKKYDLTTVEGLEKCKSEILSLAAKVSGVFQDYATDWLVGDYDKLKASIGKQNVKVEATAKDAGKIEIRANLGFRGEGKLQIPVHIKNEYTKEEMKKHFKYAVKYKENKNNKTMSKEEFEKYLNTPLPASKTAYISNLSALAKQTKTSDKQVSDFSKASKEEKAAMKKEQLQLFRNEIESYKKNGTLKDELSRKTVDTLAKVLLHKEKETENNVDFDLDGFLEKIIKETMNTFEKGVSRGVADFGKNRKYKISSLADKAENLKVLEKIDQENRKWVAKISERVFQMEKMLQSAYVKSRKPLLDYEAKKKITSKTMEKISYKNVSAPKVMFDYGYSLQNAADQCFYETLKRVYIYSEIGNAVKADDYACALAALYFQMLVSNTPIDEDYRGKRAVKRVRFDWDRTEGMERDEIEEAVENKKNYYIETVDRTISHKADKVQVRADWVLHFKGMSFKAFEFFGEDMFVTKNDFAKAAKMAEMLKVATKDSKVNKVGFNVTNDSKYIKYLEMGGWGSDSSPIRGSEGSKYGFEHGVKDRHTYQAPRGFVRLVNAQYNAMVDGNQRNIEAIISKFASTKFNVGNLGIADYDALVKGNPEDYLRYIKG